MNVDLPKPVQCSGCKQEITPDCCWCGMLRVDHEGEAHCFVPAGCDCHRVEVLDVRYLHDSST